MHKHKIYKRQLGGSFGNDFSKANLAKLLEQFKSKSAGLQIGSISGIPGASDDIDQPEAAKLSGMLGAGLNTALNAGLAFSDINNSNMNRTQKTIARSDAGVDTVSSLASFIPGVGGLVGGALSGLNKLGGGLIGNPSAVKNYVGNEEVQNTSAYGGVTAKMGEVENSISTYKGAGFFGKLFGKKKIKNDINETNAEQSSLATGLRNNALYKDRAASSTTLFSTNNKNKLNGNPWGTNAIQYGQEGTKFKGQLRNPKTNPNTEEKIEQNAVGKTQVDPFGEALAAPQKSATWLLTGKYTTPSNAMGIQNQAAKTAVDFVLDPMNLLAFSKLSKLGKLGKAAEVANGPAIFLNKNPTLVRYQQLLRESTAAGLRNKSNFMAGSIATDKALDARANTISNGIQSNKAGGKIDFKKIIRDVKKPTPVITQEEVFEVEYKKEGGSINVIVDGHLHARKHDLKELEQFKDADITDKGVAVVTYSEGGDLIQCAEVEKDELILHLSLTKRMEELAEDGSEEAMIEAGRILARELVKNTRDSKSKIIKNA